MNQKIVMLLLSFFTVQTFYTNYEQLSEQHTAFLKTSTKKIKSEKNPDQKTLLERAKQNEIKAWDHYKSVYQERSKSHLTQDAADSLRAAQEQFTELATNQNFARRMRNLVAPARQPVLAVEHLGTVEDQPAQQPTQSVTKGDLRDAVQRNDFNETHSILNNPNLKRHRSSLALDMIQYAQPDSKMATMLQGFAEGKKVKLNIRPQAQSSVDAPPAILHMERTPTEPHLFHSNTVPKGIFNKRHGALRPLDGPQVIQNYVQHDPAATMPSRHQRHGALEPMNDRPTTTTAHASQHDEFFRI